MDNDAKGECWSPKYRNDSRPWIIAPAPTVCGGTEESITTTNRVVFTHKCPAQRMPQMRHATKGRRRQLVEDQLWHQVAERIRAELDGRCNDNQQLERSEYTDQFVAATTSYEDSDRVLQMNKQYPLYGSLAQSVWMERKGNLCGRTGTSLNQPNAVFHKSSAFSKPLREVLDIPKENSIGYK